MNSQRPDDKREKPQYMKGDGHHKGSGWGKWLWPLLIALGALAALSLCSREDHRDRVQEPADRDVIIEEQQEEQEKTP
jgi:hypothetical protein